MSSKPFSIRLMLIGISCFAVGAIAESIRLTWVVADFKETLASSEEMADIKAPLGNVGDALGGALSFWQILMLVGVTSLTIGLLITLVRLARTRDQVGRGGGCGGCH